MQIIKLVVFILVALNFSTVAKASVTLNCGYERQEGSFSNRFVFTIDLDGKSAFKDLYATKVAWSNLMPFARDQNAASFKSKSSILTFIFPLALLDGRQSEANLSFASPFGSEPITCFAVK